MLKFRFKEITLQSDFYDQYVLGNLFQLIIKGNILIKEIMRKFINARKRITTCDMLLRFCKNNDSKLLKMEK